MTCLFSNMRILQTLSEEFNNPIQQAMPAIFTALAKGENLKKTVSDLFKTHFPHNYPFIYKIITFSCIKFAISDIYAYLCNEVTELPHVVQERAEGPKAPSPGQRPGYISSQQGAL